MAGITITLGGNFAFLNQLQAKVAETAAKIKTGFSERIGHRILDELVTTAKRLPEAIKYSIDAASDLGETVSKVGVIFGENKDAMMSWAEDSAKAFGLSRAAALAAAADYGNLFNAMGLGAGQTMSMSTALVALAADLASFNNTSVPDAIQAIGAALRGEAEPIRRYGVLLDDATLKAEAMAQGIFDGKGSLEPATRAMAAYGLIIEQTASAQGDFARTSDGLANSQRQIAAEFENLAAEVGEHFLPMAEEFAAWLKTIDVSGVAEGVGTLVSTLRQLSQVLLFIDKLNPGGQLRHLMSILNGGSTTKTPPKVPQTKEEEASRAEAKQATAAAAAARIEEAKATEKAADAYDKAKDKYQSALAAADKARFDALPLQAQVEELNAAEKKLREGFNTSIRTFHAGESGQQIAAAVKQAQEKGHGNAAGNTESLRLATELIGIEQKRAAILKEQAKIQDEAEKKRSAAIAEYSAELELIRAKVEGDKAHVAELEREAAIRERIASLVEAGVDPGEARRRAEIIVSAERDLKIADKRRENEKAMAEARSIANGTEGTKLESNEDFLSKIRDTRAKMDGLTYQPGITAVDSMQRIGGGGGYAGVDSTIAYQRTQTDLQREMVRLLGEMREHQQKPLD